MGDSARRVLAVVAVVAPIVVACLLGTGVIAGKNGPALTVSIGPAVPYPSPGDENVLGRVGWDVDPPVVVRARKACPWIGYSSSAPALFDGFYAESAGETLGGGSSRLEASGVWRTRDQVFGNAGEVVVFRAKATCGNGSAVTATRAFSLPAASCAEGPLHAYKVWGVVRRYDYFSRGRRLRLRTGDLVPGDASVRVDRGGGIVLGASECNGFRLVLGPGQYGMGGYEVGSRGYAFEASRALVRADRHAGGIALPDGVLVEPLDGPCYDRCDRPDPSSYEVRSGPAESAKVRVYRGTVLTRTGSAQAVVRAGEEVSALCTRPYTCRLTRVRLFQPYEPWSSPPGLRPHPLETTIAGSTVPPQRMLAPERSTAQMKVIEAAGGEPAQIVVAWQRDVRTAAGTAAGNLDHQQGLLIWQREHGGWRLVYRYRSHNTYGVGFTTADVNGDGHADVLVSDYIGGSGGCADYHLLAAARGRIVELLRDLDLCEGGLKLLRSRLVVQKAIGPCPFGDGGAHCYGGEETTVRRWRGTRLVVKTTTVKCDLSRLDPKRGCRPRKR